MKRAVVTLTRKGGDPFLDECIASVAASGNPHIILECGDEWGQVLYQMKDCADAVAWVDSDDYVYPDVMNKAFELMEQTQVGVVYTDEEVWQDGKVVFTKAVDQDLKFFRKFPFTVHHLAITRKGSISERALKCIDQMNTIYDWPMRLDAAVNFGIKRLPKVGYAWRKHAAQETQSPNRAKYLQHSLDVVRKEYAQ